MRTGTGDFGKSRSGALRLESHRRPTGARVSCCAVEEGFRAPDWHAPLDLQARLEQLPNGLVVKGMFLQGFVDEAYERSGRRPGRGAYTTFRDYPLREMLELMAETVELAYPHVPPREGLRRLGHIAYPTFAHSTVGRVVMSMVGDDPKAALHHAPKSYRLIGNAGTANVIDVAEKCCILELRDVWGWPDAYNVGVHEGAIEEWGLEGDIRVRVHSMCDVDLRIEWW